MKKGSKTIFTLAIASVLTLTSIFVFGDLVNRFVDSKLKVVIVNEDSGTTYNNEQLFLGDTFVKMVEKDKEVIWMVANRSRAEEMLQNNLCDAAIYIPYNFSELSMQLDEVSPQSTIVTYRINNASEYITNKDVNKFLIEFESSMNSKLTYLYFDVALQSVDSARHKIESIVTEQTEIQAVLGDDFSRDMDSIQENISIVVTQMDKDVSDVTSVGTSINSIGNSQEIHGEEIDDVKTNIDGLGQNIVDEQSNYQSSVIDAKTGNMGLDETANILHNNLEIIRAYLSDGKTTGNQVVNSTGLLSMMDDFFRFDVTGDSQTLYELKDDIDNYTATVIANKRLIEDTLRYYYGSSLDLSQILSETNPNVEFQNAINLTFDELKLTQFYQDEFQSQLNGIDGVIRTSKVRSLSSACSSLQTSFFSTTANSVPYTTARSICSSLGLNTFQAVNQIALTVSFGTPLTTGDYRITLNVNGSVVTKEFSVASTSSSETFTLDTTNVTGVVSVSTTDLTQIVIPILIETPVGTTMTVHETSTPSLSAANQVTTINNTYSDIDIEVASLKGSGYVAANNEIAISSNVRTNSNNLFQLYKDIVVMESNLNLFYAEVNLLSVDAGLMRTYLQDLLVDIDGYLLASSNYLVATNSYNVDLVTHSANLTNLKTTVDGISTETLDLYNASLALLDSTNMLGEYSQSLLLSKTEFRGRTVQMKDNTSGYRSNFDVILQKHSDAVTTNQKYNEEYQKIFENSYQEGAKNEQLMEYLLSPVVISGDILRQGHLLIPYFTILLLYIFSFITSVYFSSKTDDSKVFQFLSIATIIAGIISGVVSGLMLRFEVSTMVVWMLVVFLITGIFTFVQYALIKHLKIGGYAISMGILALYLLVNGLFTIVGGGLTYQILNVLSVLKYFDTLLRAILFNAPWNIFVFILVSIITIGASIGIPYFLSRRKVA